MSIVQAQKKRRGNNNEVAVRLRGVPGVLGVASERGAGRLVSLLAGGDDGKWHGLSRDRTETIRKSGCCTRSLRFNDLDDSAKQAVRAAWGDRNEDDLRL